MAKRMSAEKRKLEIVAATLELAFECGPEGITTERIAQKVGITQPAVFRHFPRKDDIWVAVADHLAAGMRERWRRVIDSDGSALGRLHAVLAAQFDLIEQTPAIPAILLSRELHVRNDVLREAITGLMANFHALLSRLLEQGVSDGDFREDLDIGDAVFTIIALVQGLAVRWSLSGRSFNLVEEGGRLIRVLINGLVTHGPVGHTGVS